jgi:hypothetical protein
MIMSQSSVIFQVKVSSQGRNSKFISHPQIRHIACAARNINTSFKTNKFWRFRIFLRTGSMGHPMLNVFKSKPVVVLTPEDEAAKQKIKKREEKRRVMKEEG